MSRPEKTNKCFIQVINGFEDSSYTIAKVLFCEEVSVRRSGVHWQIGSRARIQQISDRLIRSKHVDGTQYIDIVRIPQLRTNATHPQIRINITL